MGNFLLLAPMYAGARHAIRTVRLVLHTADLARLKLKASNISMHTPPKVDSASLEVETKFFLAQIEQYDGSVSLTVSANGVTQGRQQGVHITVSSGTYGRRDHGLLHS